MPIVTGNPGGGVVRGPRESHGEEVQFRERLAAVNREIDRKAGLVLPSDDQWAWTATAKRRKAKKVTPDE